MSARALIAATAFTVALAPLIAGAQDDTCIPVAQGVPAQPGPPPFWDTPPTAATPLRFDDPRWRGAFQAAFDGDILRFRSLRYEEGGQTYLLLSFDVRVDGSQQDDGRDGIVIGLYGDSGTPLRIEVERTLASSLSSAGAETLHGGTSNGALEIDVYSGTETGGSVTWGALVTPMPAWAADARIEADFTRTDLPVTRCEAWRVSLRIPIGGIEGVDADPTGPLRFFARTDWVAARSDWQAANPDADAGAGSGVSLAISEVWPSGATGGIPFPPLGSWDTFQLTNATTCRQGVRLERAHLGSTNSDPHTIAVPGPEVTGTDAGPNPSASNTLYARPQNVDLSSVDGTAVRARFRLANWGSAVGDSPRWEDISGCEAAPGIATRALGEHLNIECTFDTGIRDRCIYVDPADSRCAALTTPPFDASNDTRAAHQCMLVDLSADDEDIRFGRASEYRNMRFVSASTFVDYATIDVGERGETDVYLVVRPRRMLPAASADSPAGRPTRGVSLDAIRDLYAQIATTTQDPFDALAARVPGYHVAVLRSTGEQVEVDGETRTLVTGQPGFGYFVGHEGPLYGWRHRIEGAEQLAPNLYRVRTHADGQVNVRVVIEAVETPNPEPLLERGEVHQPPCFSDDCNRCVVDPTAEGCDEEEVELDPEETGHGYVIPLVLLALLVLALLVFGVYWSRRRASS